MQVTQHGLSNLTISELSARFGRGKLIVCFAIDLN